MTVTLAQPAAANHSSTQVTSLTVTLPSPATAHNCLVACIGGHNTNVVTGVTSGGLPDHWVAGATSDAGAVTSEIWIDPDCAATTTVTAQTTVNGLLIVQVFEFAGVATSSPLDVTAPGGLSLPPVSSWSSGSTGTARAGDVVVGSCCGFAGGGAYSLTGPGGSWTNELYIQTSLSGIWTRLIAGYEVLSGSGAATYSGTSSASQSYGAVAVALKSATGGGAGSSGSFLPFFA